MPRPISPLFQSVTFALLAILLIPALAFAEKLSGTMLISIVDYNDGSSKRHYDLLAGDGTVTRINTAGLEKHILDSFKTGAMVTVSGAVTANGLQAASAVVDSPAPLVASSGVIGGASVTGTRSLAIIIANFSGGASVSCSAASIESVVFTGTPSMRGLYEASSRGQVTWPRDTNADTNADIFGPYAINQASGTCDDPLDGGWATAAKRQQLTLASICRSINTLRLLFQGQLVVIPEWHT